jgi:hypothetical protein
MLKLYPKLLLGFFMLLCSYLSFAQISVTATVGTTGPTTYTTLRGAFDAINAGTHKGVIAISVTGNTTETLKDSLVASGAGAASYTSILIKPATGVTATITGNNTNSLVELNGANNVTFDGSNTAGGTTKNLSFINNNNDASAASNTFRISNGASNNIFKNLIIQGATTSSGVFLMGNSTATTGNNNNLLDNNTVTKSVSSPIAAVYNIGTTGLPNSNNIYRNNKISDFSGYGFLDGNATVGFSNNTLVEGNEIFMTAPQSNVIYGMRLNNISGVVNMTISKNWIHDLNTTVAGAVYGIDLYDAASVTVVNNMIALDVPSATSLRGIAQETDAGSVIKIYYNTVSISGTTSGTNASFCYLKNYLSTGDDVRNNIFTNTRVSSGTGKQYAVANVSSTATVIPYTSNYNDLVSTGNAMNFVGLLSTTVAATDYASLATWQAAASADANSISIAPVFTSATNLHLVPASNLTLDNKGIAIAGITTDFDGDTRSATTPDVGADEYTASTVCVAPVITVQPANVAACSTSTATLVVTATGTSLTYQWRKAGVNVAGATSASYAIPNVAQSNAGSYDVVITNGCGTQTSTSVTLTVNAGPVITTNPTAQSACTGTSVTLTSAATGTGLTYQWRKGGVNIAGATNATYNIAAVAAADAGSYDVVVGNGTCTTTSTAAVLTVNAGSTWTGTTSTDWNVATNWCGGVPTATSDITIASGTTNSPIITGTSNNVRNLTIGAGATLTIPTGTRLNVYGNLANSGTLTATAGTLAFQGTSAQTSTAFNVGTLVLNGAGGVTLSGNATAGTLTLTSGNLTLGTNTPDPYQQCYG